jgi:hypothetical protein
LTEYDWPSWWPHIYTKIGVSNRAGASLFALQHRLLPDEAPV